MTTKKLFASTVAAALFIGCASQKGNFGEFLSTEIVRLGGNTNHLSSTLSAEGKWKTKRGPHGTAIDAEGISFQNLTNALTTVYGAPIFYCAANERHGPEYIYPPSSVGISIFVASTPSGAEVTLTKPILGHP